MANLGRGKEKIKARKKLEKSPEFPASSSMYRDVFPCRNFFLPIADHCRAKINQRACFFLLLKPQHFNNLLEYERKNHTAENQTDACQQYRHEI